MKGLIIIAALVTAGYARPEGAPLEACETLTPNHGNNNPQTSMSPFTVDLSPFLVHDNGSGSGSSYGYYYVPGYTYRLQLIRQPDDTSTFRGFFVQSRTAADDTTRVGTFGVVNSELAKIGQCTPTNSSITHTNNMDKTMMLMNWTAPPPGTGAIRFRYAVVQVYAVFWANLRTDEVYETPTETGGNCSDVVCNSGQMCIEYDMPMCVCSDGYAYNPNSDSCEAGELNLPIRLDATVVDYDRECSDLDTTGQRYDIYDVVRTTIQKSRLYRYFN
jgi:hypothetical protein